MAPLGNQKPVSVVGWGGVVACIIVTVTMFLTPAPVYAWGSITHIAICRQAGGTDDFAMGGQSPDIIALYTTSTGDHSYDYAHNLHAVGNGSSFGQIMYSLSGSEFARGWLAHQRADAVVHGPNGYSNNKTCFSDLPEKYRTDLGHGATELIVDAILLQEYFGGTVAFYVPDQARLIHETAVFAYNDCLRARRFPRKSIIGCHLAERLSYQWEGWLGTNLYLTQLMVEEPWFPDLKQDYLDYRPLFSKSVALAQDGAEMTKVPRQQGWVDHLISLLMPQPIATAKETEKNGDDTAYYSFVLKLGNHARGLTGGRITKESVRQAIADIDTEQGLTDKEKVWARLMEEMFVQDNKDFASIEKNVETYGRELDLGRLPRRDNGLRRTATSNLGRESGPKKGAISGRTGRGFLPCLPTIIIVCLVIAGLVQAVRRFSKRR